MWSKESPIPPLQGRDDFWFYGTRQNRITFPCFFLRISKKHKNVHAMELTQSKWNYHSTSIISNILSQINKQRYKKSAYSNSYCDYQQDKVFSSTICYRLAGNKCSIIYDRSKKCWSCKRNVKQSTCVCHHNSLNAFYLQKTETCNY